MKFGSIKIIDGLESVWDLKAGMKTTKKSINHNECSNN
jgi:hypothetical protein